MTFIENTKKSLYYFNSYPEILFILYCHFLRQHKNIIKLSQKIYHVGKYNSECMNSAFLYRLSIVLYIKIIYKFNIYYEFYTKSKFYFSVTFSNAFRIVFSFPFKSRFPFPFKFPFRISSIISNKLSFNKFFK